MRGHNRLVNFGRIASAIPFAVAGGAALAGGGGAAALPAAATEGIEFSAAPTATGGGMTLGRILGSRGFELGSNAITSLLGMRSQNRANRYATDANARLSADQIQLERDRIKRQEDVDAADRADAERRWLAEQAQRKQDYDALQEERTYRRTLDDRNVRLDDEREARRAGLRRSLGALLRKR